MNLSDLYAICCLLVWGGSLGIAVAMLCRGKSSRNAKPEPFPSLSFINALIVGILLTMILLTGNPDYLGGILWGLTLFLALAGMITLRFRMQKYGTIFATAGTVGLYLFLQSDCLTMATPRPDTELITCNSVRNLRSLQKKINIHTLREKWTRIIRY